MPISLSLSLEQDFLLTVIFILIIYLLVTMDNIIFLTRSKTISKYVIYILIFLHEVRLYQNVLYKYEDTRSQYDIIKA